MSCRPSAAPRWRRLRRGRLPIQELAKRRLDDGSLDGRQLARGEPVLEPLRHGGIDGIQPWPRSDRYQRSKLLAGPRARRPRRVLAATQAMTVAPAAALAANNLLHIAGKCEGPRHRGLSRCQARQRLRPQTWARKAMLTRARTSPTEFREFRLRRDKGPLL